MLSLLRGLTASISTNVSSLKRQAKRLHKASQEIFGHQITIEQAEEAIAKANGFYRWSEISDISVKAGLDRNTPFWHILGRNDTHSTVLSALLTTEVEVNENGPVVFLGSPEDAALSAMCLFAETISHRAVPGLILINTKAKSLQDTAIGRATEQLGIGEQIARYRVIDLREKTIPVSIHAEPMVWVRSYKYLFSKETAKLFDSSGADHLFEKLITTCGKESRWFSETETDLPFSIVKKAEFYFRQPSLIETGLLPFLSDQDKAALASDVARYTAKIPEDFVSEISLYTESLNALNFDQGVSLWHESERRPVIVLFDRDMAETEILASAIHGMFYSRFAFVRKIRPVLYFSDAGRATIPQFLSFGSESIIVNGSNSSEDETWKDITMGRASFGKVENGCLTYSGRRVALP